jgi:hypothetical protein
MKKVFICLLFAPLFASAQNFNPTNEASIGSLQSLFLCDSNTFSYASTVGSNVTWDYSQLAGIFGVVKDVQIKDATLDAEYASFAGAQKTMEIGSTLRTFYSSDASSRISQGFVFNEVSLGNVVASWPINNELLMNYPFALGASTSDVFDGTITSTNTGTIPTNGVSMTSADGIGTLLLPGGSSYSNVLRFHLKDSATAIFFNTPVHFVRNQFEYYDFTISNLPIFLYSNIKLESALLNNSSTLVLSKDQPTTFVGLEENETEALTIYPNPVQNLIQINGNFDPKELSICDLNGAAQNYSLENSTLDVTQLPAGVYFIKSGVFVKKFIKL